MYRSCCLEALEERRLLSFTLTDLQYDYQTGEGLIESLANTPDINNTGVIAAQTSTNGSIYHHAALRISSTKLVDVGNFAFSTVTYPFGMNDANQVVGIYTGSKGTSHGFLSALGKKNAVALQKLPEIKNFTGTVPLAINKTALIVGSAGEDNGKQEAVVWTRGAGGTYTIAALPQFKNPIGILGHLSSVAMDVSDAGVVVGTAVNGNVMQRAVLWKKGSKGYAMTDLGSLTGSIGFSWASAVNELGQVVGTSTGKDFKQHPVLFSLNSKGKYSITDLGLPAGADAADAVDINESGAIVGRVTFGSEDHAAMWTKNSKGKYTFTDLNAKLPANSNWSLDQATSINDSGAIVGVGVHIGSTTWLLSPSGKGFDIIVT